MFSYSSGNICCDPNGNITDLTRQGVTTQMDDFFYNYTTGTNQLTHVDDLATSTNYTDDIDDQNAANYTYTAIGELYSDEAENISAITWRVDGKVSKVERGSNTAADAELEFYYDAFGRRVLKISKPTDSNGDPVSQDQWTYTYYINDASGNVMSTYTLTKGTTTHDLDLEEQYIYGSSRLGNLTRDKLIAQQNVSTSVVTQSAADELEHEAGTRRYEYSNHLGNVLLVTSDKRIAVYDGSGNFTHFEPDIMSYSDYYPFGALMPGRNSNTGDYDYKHQGQLSDPEIQGEGNSYAYTYRMSDPRLGRFWSVDPLASRYPHNSPYAFSENRVIDAFELEGREAVFVHGVWAHPLSEGMDGSQKQLVEILFNLSGNSEKNIDFDWQEGRRVTEDGERKGRNLNKGWPRLKDMRTASDMLVEHTLKVRETMGIPDSEPITLIGLSGGGPVAIKAAKKLADMGYKVNVITYNSPAAKGSAGEFIPDNSINKGLFISTKGDPVAPRWFRFGREFKEGSIPDKFEQKQIENNDYIWLFKHLSKNAPIETLINVLKTVDFKKEKPEPVEPIEIPAPDDCPGCENRDGKK